ncbi:isochorismatase family cysteine hydrolase [Comamonas sp. Y6]|uniref:Isochorismatase family cysteine hydrolase n=1 Tax=Comamonas resistens TaxID=3046670 RepID=A0ABY8SQK9_9BURK|nr:isochorismatase family cysteine hydrolase [Comamonas resistens]MDL5035817.1 isochorismatase family cysteine hydrolase [Comamonas resistens]WHS65228.1 isochorismatase family cysteine hydrolase [Comamonas resistens]HBP0978983.1 cysteine hydrolase [Pseudomonas aeruginosa]
MRILVVVDMQEDFIRGILGTQDAQNILADVRAKIDGYLAAGDVVIYTQDTHTSDYLQTQEGRKLPVAHCIKGTHGWEIVPEVLVQGCAVIEKPSFGSLALADHVQELSGVTAIEVIGVCTDICVISNAMILRAALPEVPIQVDASCCAGSSPVGHSNALQAMQACQIEVVGG